MSAMEFKFKAFRQLWLRSDTCYRSGNTIRIIVRPNFKTDFSSLLAI